MSELVSVIITTYMREPEIVFRAVNSVLAQTYPELEILVIDDSPITYEYRETLKDRINGLNKRIKYIQLEKNMGACAARNTGLAAANGDYIAFLDDDDEWLPEKIEKQLQGFQDAQTALVYCGKMLVDDSSGTVSLSQTEYRCGYVYDTLIYTNYIGSTSFPLIRKEYLMEIGGFDPLMKSAQDYDVWLRLAQKYKVAYISEPLVKYHVHSGERISTNFQSRIAGQERLIQKNMDYLNQNPRAWWWRHMRLTLPYSQSLQLRKSLQIWKHAAVKCPQKVFINLKYMLQILVVYCRGKVHK